MVLSWSAPECSSVCVFCNITTQSVIFHTAYSYLVQIICPANNMNPIGFDQAVSFVTYFVGLVGNYFRYSDGSTLRLPLYRRHTHFKHPMPWTPTPTHSILVRSGQNTSGFVKWTSGSQQQRLIYGQARPILSASTVKLLIWIAP